MCVSCVQRRIEIDEQFQLSQRMLCKCGDVRLQHTTQHNTMHTPGHQRQVFNGAEYAIKHVARMHGY